MLAQAEPPLAVADDFASPDSAPQYSFGPASNLDLAAPPATLTRPPLLFNPRISVNQSFTDNARASAPGRQQADMYTTVTPGFALDYSGAHNRLNVDYSLDKINYLYNDDLNALNHRYNHSSQSELVDGFLFLDTQASISQITLNAQGDVSSDSNVVFKDNSTTQVAVNGSPYARYGIGGYANLESRYSFGKTMSLSEGAQNSETHQFSQTVASGYEFDRFLWGLTLSGGFTDYSGQATFGPSGDRRTTNRLVKYSTEVPIVREFSLLGSAGYERIDDNTLVDQPNGPIWSIGFRVRPGPRTSMRLEYTDRYNRARLGGSLVYLISNRSSFQISYSQSLASTQAALGNNLTFLAPDGFGNLVDVRTGRALSLNDSLFGISSGSFLSDRLEATLVLGGQYHTSTFTGFQEKRSGSTGGQPEQNAFGINYSYFRSLNERLNFAFFTTFSMSETPASGANGTSNTGSLTGTGLVTSDGILINTINTNAGNETHTISAGGSLAYAVTDSLRGTASYRFTYRDSNTSGGDLRENIIVFGLSKAF